VRRARLEAASSKLFFELNPAQQQQQQAGAAPAAAGDSSSSSSATKKGKAAAASSKQAAATAVSSAASASSPATAPAAPAGAARRFFVKLADKQDPYLVGKVLAAGACVGQEGLAREPHMQACAGGAASTATATAELSSVRASRNPLLLLLLLLARAGVEYGVVRASLQQQLTNMLMVMASLWIPLLPLLWFASRAMEQRSNMRRKKNATSSNTPSITFADVAGAGCCCVVVWCGGWAGVCAVCVNKRSVCSLCTALPSLPAPPP
jgi:hypothetical protein